MRSPARRLAAAGILALGAAAVFALFLENDVPASARTLRAGILALCAGFLFVAVRSARALVGHQQTLRHDEAILRAAASSTDQFVRNEDWRDCIDSVLEKLGTGAGVSRAYVYENVTGEDGRILMEMIFEWCAPGVPGTIDRADNHGYPYLPDFPNWHRRLSHGEPVAGRLSDFEANERETLVEEGILSAVFVPVFVDDEWWGYFGFDECASERVWSPVEVGVLGMVAETLGAAIGRQGADRARREAEARYKTLVENMPAITYTDALDDTAATIFISPQVEATLGYTPEEWMADPELWEKLLHPDDRETAIAENIRHNETGSPFSFEYRVRARDGREVWIRDDAVIVRDDRGRPLFSQGVMRDITERKQAEEKLAFLAYHDELTGLPNYAMFRELLDISIARAKRHGAGAAVLAVDLDNFRLVNDSLGHEAADELLRQVAGRLGEATRETDLVARRGGDEFLLLLGDLERSQHAGADSGLLTAESVAGRVQEAFLAPFNLSAEEFYVSSSIGISIFPLDAHDAEELLQNAEAAMHASKAAGPGGYVISSAGPVESMTKLSFVTRLRKAVDGKHWVLHYQPVVSLGSGAMIGVEALLRWQDPDGEMIPPNEFIPLAEELGLIEKICDWVVEELARQDGEWRSKGLEVDLGFNLSARQFWQPDLGERILERLTDGGTDPGRVIVEITESSAMKDPERAQWVLWDLHTRGLRLAIDDFGTGYSSLWRLRNLPVDVLKIDRSFVSGVDTAPESASIVKAFIELAHALGKTTLAEGIERPEEWHLLTEQGCQQGQGFFFCRPVPAEEITGRFLSGELTVSPDA